MPVSEYVRKKERKREKQKQKGKEENEVKKSTQNSTYEWYHIAFTNEKDKQIYEKNMTDNFLYNDKAIIHK